MPKQNSHPKLATQYYLGQDFLQTLQPYLAGRKVLFVLEQCLWDKGLRTRLSAYPCLTLAGGEGVKTWQAVEDLVERLWQAELDRSSLLIAIGGGALLDMVGFVASCYMRGVDYCLVPSTLLAQVDAAIGGKTAINFGNYKNLFGTFAHPLAVVWDYSFLHSLPEKHFQGAMAEIIKHAAIASPTLWRELASLSLTTLRNSPEVLAAIIAQNVQIKQQIVQEDFREQGQRKLLNFGHSLAHALEQVYRLEHAEAVAIGMLFACRWSVELIKARADLPEQMYAMLRNYALPTEVDFAWEAVLPLLKMDKKRDSTKLNLVLLQDIAQPQIYPISLLELGRLSRL